MQSPNSGMNTAAWDSLKGMCAAVQYAGALPISHPLLSPVHAGPELLRHFPPLLLIVGGADTPPPTHTHSLSLLFSSPIFPSSKDNRDNRDNRRLLYRLLYCDLHNNRPKTAETSAIRVS
jgi:hypothetical protein